ncbi:hypothetical protein ASZ90_020027 [hydrocarbon metagenome]|uniref:Uncharacterized protein n=1 Tax=hydrocarbon metagenome TaxID=938273 RepID=A0A0W8E2V1_9ZZZZ
MCWLLNIYASKQGFCSEIEYKYEIKKPGLLVDKNILTIIDY